MIFVKMLLNFLTKTLHFFYLLFEDNYLSMFIFLISNVFLFLFVAKKTGHMGWT